MNILADTSAFFSLLAKNDRNYPTARRIWSRALDAGDAFFTSSYIVVEATALLQNRLGMEAVIAFHTGLLPLVTVEMVDTALHQSGVSIFLAANRRRLSLVDCVSFELCRRLGVTQVFALDGHFEERGFQVLF